MTRSASDAYTGLGDRKAATAATEKFGELRKGVAALARAADLYRGQGWREDALATAREAADRAKEPAEKAEALHRLGELAWERGEPEEAVAQFDAALGRNPATTRPWRERRGPWWRWSAPTRRWPRTTRSPGCRGRSTSSNWASCTSPWSSTGTRGAGREARRAAGAGEGSRGRRVRHPGPLRERPRGPGGGGGAAARPVEEAAPQCGGGDALGWALHRAGKSEEGLEYAQQAVDTGVRNASYAYRLGVIEQQLARSGPARRHLEEALRTNPGCSPLDAPKAREALETLGEPSPGGPGDSSRRRRLRRPSLSRSGNPSRSRGRNGNRSRSWSPPAGGPGTGPLEDGPRPVEGGPEQPGGGGADAPESVRDGLRGPAAGNERLPETAYATAVRGAAPDRGGVCIREKAGLRGCRASPARARSPRRGP
ncbi:hypothetical protein SMICM304S_05551 [Streptomyces microflavus]